MPTKSKYVFAGYWSADGVQYVKADGTSARNSNFKVATTLYAKWVPVGSYLLVFQGEGKASYEQSYARDSVFNLPPCQFTGPDGKTFKGRAGSNGRRYDDGVLVFNAADEGKILTLTAIWE